VNLCFCCVRFSFSIPSQEIGFGNVSEMTYFLSSGSQNLNSENSVQCWYVQVKAQSVAIVRDGDEVAAEAGSDTSVSEADSDNFHCMSPSLLLSHHSAIHRCLFL